MKIIGCLFIITASILASYLYEKRLKYQSTQLKEISKFVSYIKTQIEFFSLSLNEIYIKFNSNNDLINKLISKEPIDLFDKQIGDELSNTFLYLGNGFKQEQITKLEYIQAFLEEKIKDLDKNYAQKTKVFRAMSLFIGCCIVILLV